MSNFFSIAIFGDQPIRPWNTKKIFIHGPELRQTMAKFNSMCEFNKKNLWTPIQSHEQRYYHFVERRNDQKKVVHLEKLYNFVFEHFLI